MCPRVFPQLLLLLSWRCGRVVPAAKLTAAGCFAMLRVYPISFILYDWKPLIKWENRTRRHSLLRVLRGAFHAHITLSRSIATSSSSHSASSPPHALVAWGCCCPSSRGFSGIFIISLSFINIPSNHLHPVEGGWGFVVAYSPLIPSFARSTDPIDKIEEGRYWLHRRMYYIRTH